MLNPYQRERIQDCLLLIQSAESTLEPFDENIIPKLAELKQCFDSAQKNLRDVLSGTLR
jgi:hypothetical protein